MLMGYGSTPHPATRCSPYEALMDRNVKRKMEYEPTSISRNYHRMEREITNRDKEYKKKQADQHRRPKCKPHHFQIGDKVLLKKRKVNKWSTAHEKEHYDITEICGSTLGARRKSDGCTLQRDASKFRLFQEAGNENW